MARGEQEVLRPPGVTEPLARRSLQNMVDVLKTVERSFREQAGADRERAKALRGGGSGRAVD